MTIEKQRRIGVWFSLALGILVLSFWPGRIAGARIAIYWYQYQERELGTLDASQRPHLESALSELETAEQLRVFSEVGGKDQEKWLATIAALNRLKQTSTTQEAQGVIDMDLGIAYLTAATAEGQNNNKEGAAKYMESARSVFQSLGWQGYSDDALTAAAERELERRNPHP